MIQKRYGELKPGDVFKLSNGRTDVLAVEALPVGRGTKVLVNGYLDADPATGVHGRMSVTRRDRSRRTAG
jgi:hypothetical protein